jgi:hypothetical protein
VAAINARSARRAGDGVTWRHILLDNAKKIAARRRATLGKGLAAPR